MEVGYGYSLWLLPHQEKPLTHRLNMTIEALAAIYNTPVFPAHVTLINDVPLDEATMIMRTRELARAFPPFRIDFHELGSNETYFQILFAVAEPQVCLWSANQRTRSVFGVDRPPYVAHMSFAYGDLNPHEVNSLMQRLQAELELPLKIVFPVLELWNTAGPICNWRCIQRITLT